MQLFEHPKKLNKEHIITVLNTICDIAIQSPNLEVERNKKCVVCNI